LPPFDLASFWIQPPGGRSGFESIPLSLLAFFSPLQMRKAWIPCNNDEMMPNGLALRQGASCEPKW